LGAMALRRAQTTGEWQHGTTRNNAAERHSAARGTTALRRAHAAKALLQHPAVRFPLEQTTQYRLGRYSTALHVNSRVVTVPLRRALGLGRGSTAQCAVASTTANRAEEQWAERAQHRGPSTKEGQSARSQHKHGHGALGVRH
jgi:hypothetical protein